MNNSKSRVFRISLAFITLLSFLLLFHGCGEEVAPGGGIAPGTPIGTLVDATGCKDPILGTERGAPLTSDCIFWEYDGSDTLRVVHVNAALNCCPGTIVGLVEVNGRSITIEETEGDDAIMCHCLCLYDLSYEISDVAAGEFTISFVEQYIPEGSEILSVTVDLESEPLGSSCVQRNTYPWSTGSLGEDPEGRIDDYSGCKTVTGTMLASTADSSCVTVHTYPGDGSMRIFHTNTAYNCCVDALDADFDIDGGIITITGREYPPGGLCDCICLYDVAYSIHNLEPGTYTLRFVEPYLIPGQEQIEITVDLSRVGTWSTCRYREGYPWSESNGEDEDRERLGEMFDAIVDYIGTP
jgi:hypothetical protein